MWLVDLNKLASKSVKLNPLDRLIQFIKSLGEGCLNLNCS